MDKDKINELEKKLADKLEDAINSRQRIGDVKILAGRYYTQIWEDTRNGYYNQTLFHKTHNKYQKYKLNREIN